MFRVIKLGIYEFDTWPGKLHPRYTAEVNLWLLIKLLGGVKFEVDCRLVPSYSNWCWTAKCMHDKDQKS